MITIRRVVGSSMEPNLQHDQIVLAYRAGKLKPGQVVIANVDGRELIKRILKIEKNNIVLQGDNLSKSIDSRVFGPVSKDNIKSVVIWPKV